MPDEQPFAFSEDNANYLVRLLALDLYAITGFALAVILARILFWPRRGEGDGRLPLAAALAIFAGAVAVPMSFRNAAEWWTGLGKLRQADVLAIAHYGLVIAIVGLLPVVFVGGALGWRWVRNFWLRLVHLLAIVIVAGQPLNGYECPLTTWERELRDGDLANLEGSWPLAHWCNRMNSIRVESLTPFLIGYSVFGVLIMVSWVVVRPEISQENGLPEPAPLAETPPSAPPPVEVEPRIIGRESRQPDGQQRVASNPSPQGGGHPGRGSL